MSSTLNEQQVRATADKLIADIDYAERAGLSKDFVDRLYAMFDRLNERAITAGLGAL